MTSLFTKWNMNINTGDDKYFIK